MMRTEDEARVSFDETLTDGTPSPDMVESEWGGSRSRKQKEKKRRKKKKGRGRRGADSQSKGQASDTGTTWCSAAFQSSTWESVGTSWLLPDLGVVFWRLTSFGILLGLSLTLEQSGRLSPFSTDVYTMSTVSTGLLLLPQAFLLVTGPHLDDLDAPSLRWVWTVISSALQLSLTHATVVFVWYRVTTGASAAWVHATPAGVLAAEVVLGCSAGRVSVAAGGAALTGVYLWAAGAGRANGLGAWAVAEVRRGGSVVAGVVAGYFAVGVAVVLVARLRAVAARRWRGSEFDADVEW